MRKLPFYIIILLTVTQINAQPHGEISLVTETGTTRIPTYTREETIYFSIKEFAEANSVNYYYNDKNRKFELKFENYLLKITARNPYYVITERRTGKQRVFQLPTSSYYKDGRIYIPLLFSIRIIGLAYGKELILSAPKTLLVGNDISGVNIDLFTERGIATSNTFFNINGLKVSEKANGTLIRVYSNKRIPSYYSSHKDGVLTIIFRQVNVDVAKTDRYNLSGLIKKIETKNVGSDAEFKFYVGEEYSTNEVMNADGNYDLLITIHNKIFTTAEEERVTREKWEFDIIVLDPGHGGKDPGALGINNIKEKDINLDVALRVGKLIEKKMKDVKVIYTRKKDKFVDLYKRGKIANENTGKLFISIHCNATKKKQTGTNGIEVYLLRPGRTEEAIAIAEMENSVIKYEEDPSRYEHLTDENFILVSMAHSSYMKYSESFADMLNSQFKHNTKLKARGVKQAGFYVLVGASMPSVLIETGFITNKKDSNYLKSNSGQQQLAEAIFDAINEYSKYYNKQMEAEL
jgi:N-acetylmuramoyl-L-alanine amidase